MEPVDKNQFEVLRGLALAGVRGEQLQGAVSVALQLASSLVGLSAAAIYLWDDRSKPRLSVSHATSESSGERLASLEQELLAGLRKERQLVAAYMTFSGKPPLNAFTLPLQHGDRVFGAVLGISEGPTRLIPQDYFLEALSAAIALNVVVSDISQAESLPSDLRDKARLSAIQETAVTVNHEINNPLTAILGNVQLLLLKRQDLDDDLVAKLRVIEASALKIKDVTQRLLRLTSARSAEYTEGTSMLDLSDED
ncbi:MAG: histidine kinase dimerization/phospho-acceptor domain-containing protein [Candidatus Zixiibacteriota bacterium]